jgi:hypothetical protein
MGRVRPGCVVGVLSNQPVRTMSIYYITMGEYERRTHVRACCANLSGGGKTNDAKMVTRRIHQGLS